MERNSGRIAVAVPPIVGALLYLVVVTAGIVGRHPIWSVEGRNLPEAAALRDGAAAVRLADQGGNVNAPAEVRARLILDDPVVLTPIEAAAGARDEAIVQLLFDLGASPDAAAWLRAFCISDAEGVRQVLRAHRPSGVGEDCAER